MKTSTGGLAPNRLSPDGQRAYRGAGSGKAVSRVMQYHPTHHSRIVNGERPSSFAEVESALRKLARDGRTDPLPLLNHLEAAVEEEYAARDRTLCLRSLIVEETRAQGVADLAQIALLDGATPAERETAIEMLERHAVEIRRTLVCLKIERRTR